MKMALSALSLLVIIASQAHASHAYFSCKNLGGTCTYSCPFDQSLFDGKARCTLQAGECANSSAALAPGFLNRIAGTKRGFWADFQDRTPNMVCQWKSEFPYPYSDGGKVNEPYRKLYGQLFGTN